jgi:hypothetical protein
MKICIFLQKNWRPSREKLHKARVFSFFFFLSLDSTVTRLLHFFLLLFCTIKIPLLEP